MGPEGALSASGCPIRLHSALAMHTLRNAFVLFATSLASLAAQQVLVVDVAGGTPFQQIQAAVNAANPGDVVEVRPGVYLPFACSKALRIEGEAGVIIQETATQSAFAVSGIPAGATCTVSQFELRSIVTPCTCEPRMSVSQCDGAVILDHIRPDYATSLEPQLDAVDVAGILVGDSIIGPVEVTRGSAYLTNTQVQSASFDAGSVIRLVDASLVMTDGLLRIRLAAGFGYGIELVNSTARLQVVNGLNVTNVFPFSGSWEFYGDAQSSVDYHPLTTFTLGTPSTPPWNSATVAMTDDLPGLAVTTAPLGGTVTVDMRYTLSPAFMFPFLSTPNGPFTLPFISGDLFTSGAFSVLIGGFDMAPGFVSTSFGIPNVAALDGQPFVVQGLCFSGGVFNATNPHGFTIR